MGLFGKKKEEIKVRNSLIQAKDLIAFVKVTENSEDELYRICDLILDGKPVLVNLDSIMTIDCNMMLNFLSGCVYGQNGEAIQIGERLFLFARGAELEDGSLYAWAEENK